MNLTAKQLWNLCGLCPWSSCSVFRSDSSDFQWGSLVFSSHFQWGSLVFSSDFQWESLVLCAFVASWAFLFHILIMPSFSVSVFLWLNVLITMTYYLGLERCWAAPPECSLNGLHVLQHTGTATVHGHCHCNVMLIEVNGCLFILSPMVCNVNGGKWVFVHSISHGL